MIALFRGPENSSKRRLVILSLSCFYLLSLGFFYWKYVPLIKAFQLALVPVLLVTIALTAARIRLGILFFVFAFPLINGLPYLFGIYEEIPHAPLALVLFLAFFLGGMLHEAFSGPTRGTPSPIFRPLGFLFLIIVVSAVVTSLRYANFFPFLAGTPRELAVNVNEVRAGGAVMSVLFNFLNYVTGFLFFALLFRSLRSKEFAKTLLITLSISACVFLIFSMVQRFCSPALGNTPLWTGLGRINSTFKDPNSFGAILSAALPLFLGLAIASDRGLRVFFSALFLLGLSVFPFTGSRSGFLGLGFSLLVFLLLILKEKRLKDKKKLIYMVVLPLIVVALIISFFIFYQKSNLHQRMELSLDLFGKEGSLSHLFTQKIEFWRAALQMVKEYPLSGVGLGAYIIEMPNYLKQMNLPFRHTDSAENYLLQVLSELGLIGLFLFFWIFLEIGRAAKRSWEESPFQGRDKFILAGAVSGLAAMLVNSVFHSYIGSFEVKYFFWLLAALVMFGAPRQKESPAGALKRPGRRIFAALAVVAFAAVHLGNSWHSLSIEERRERFGWAQDFGFYKPESDHRGFPFRWARKQAGLAIDSRDRNLIIPMNVSHPDVAEHPVKVRVFLSDRYFRGKRLLEEVVFSNSGWMDREFILPESPDQCSYLIFDSDREWQPLQHSGVPDPRWLAWARGDIWFQYPKELAAERIAGIQKIPVENWQGKWKDRLSAGGTSFLKFQSPSGEAAFRLQIKGQKAFGLGPYIVVRLNNRIIGRTVITNEGWTSLIFEAPVEKGEKTFSVEYTNDIYRPDLGQDRNVFLGDVEILSLHPKSGS